MHAGFANTPPPPYYAVIFTSRRTEGDQGYEEMAEAMFELAQKQPGCLGAESVRGADGLGITVAYFIDEASISAWKQNTRHRALFLHGEGQASGRVRLCRGQGQRDGKF